MNENIVRLPSRRNGVHSVANEGKIFGNIVPVDKSGVIGVVYELIDLSRSHTSACIVSELQVAGHLELSKLISFLSLDAPAKREGEQAGCQDIIHH